MPSSPSKTPAKTLRLNKAIADSGLCSRREADRLVKAGRVTVNKKVVLAPGTAIVSETDHIRVDNKPLPQMTRHYLLFHKPKDCLTTRKDEKNRKTIYEYLPKHYHDCDPAGRLDRNTTGLMILSNDGAFVHTVTHPSSGLAKTYRARLDKPLTEAHARQLFKGILLMPENKLATVTACRPVEDGQVEVVLLTGYNRQIRRSFEQLGYQVLTLKRTAMGPLRLGHLKPGECRPLLPKEKATLLSGLIKTGAAKAQPKAKTLSKGTGSKQPGANRSTP